MAFHIKPDKKESVNKTIRFPAPLVDEIEIAITNRNTTFSGFIIQACQYALENLSPDDESEETNEETRENTK